MSEQAEDNGRAKKIFRFCLKYPVNILFASALLYFLANIYILGHDTLSNKAYLCGTAGLWVLWHIAKSFLKLILTLIIIGGLIYGYYYYTHYDELVCKDSGGVWNKELKICEEKNNILQKLQKWWKQKAVEKIF